MSEINYTDTAKIEARNNIKMRTDPNLAAYREYVRFCQKVWHCPPASFEVWAKETGRVGSLNFSYLGRAVTGLRT